MKSIQEAKWKVDVWDCCPGYVCWRMWTIDVIGFAPDCLKSNDMWKTIPPAKRAFLRFAKINGLKNWEWVG